LQPETENLNHAPPALVDSLRSNAFAYFRFINRPWTARVCEVFVDDVRDLPIVRLHGDAHIEQFALTNDAWGLDDFDDTARGPALVDIVRMLGSIDLATRLRGWTRHREALFDRFLQGYRRGLLQPDYRPPPPAIVGRLRREASRSREEFLAWGEALMEPMTDLEMTAVVAGVQNFARIVSQERPDLPREYLQVVGAGWIHLGVGSALSRKILIRLRGPSADPADDELVEGKELGDLGGLGCLEDPPSQPTLRIIGGTASLGRMTHKILAAGPEFVIPELWTRPQHLNDWWIRSWDPSYREVHLDDIRSVKDLAEIAYDAGVQLGGGSLREESAPRDAIRKQSVASLATLDKRIRRETLKLVDELLLGWRELALTRER
jgi:hypothetical protein